MNREAVKNEITNIIEAQQAKQVTRKQYPVAKHQIATLTELGIIDLMPTKFGYTDAAVVIEAAKNNGAMVGGFNASGEGDVVKASASTLYTLLNEVEVTPEPTPSTETPAPVVLTRAQKEELVILSAELKMNQEQLNRLRGRKDRSILLEIERNIILIRGMMHDIRTGRANA